MSSDNLAKRAYEKTLSVDDVMKASLKKLKEDKHESYAGSVLYWASFMCPTEVVEAILDKGVPINQMTGAGSTALMGAIRNSKWATVKMLVKRGIDVTLKDTSGITALHEAAYEGAPIDILQLIIDAGADVQVKNNKGETPADKARNNNRTSIATFLDSFLPPTKSAVFLG